MPSLAGPHGLYFDTLITGGHIVDPAQGLNGPMDVAITGDRIAAIEPGIPVSSAVNVVDASGQWVTPGLIDLHTHIFRGIGYWGVDADSIGCQTGVTTWVDAGSAGAFTLPGFREFVAAETAMRVRAFMNISYLGLVGLNYDEYCNLDACDPRLFQVVANAHRDLVVGIKVRTGTGTVGNQGLEPLRRALIAADSCGLPIMVHIAKEPPSASDVLALMRPGDILTHMCTGQTARIVDPLGSVFDAVVRARARGVIFDVGHGSGSFSFESAEALAKVNFWPDVISTDLHQVSIHGENTLDPLALDVLTRVRGDGAAALTLPIAIDKFLFLGMPFEDAIRATTETPAHVIGMDGQVGTLRPGAYADVALFVREEGRYPLFDIYGNRRVGRERLRNTRTFVGGRELQCGPTPPPPWIQLRSV